jgi:hypothetical protein
MNTPCPWNPCPRCNKEGLARNCKACLKQNGREPTNEEWEKAIPTGSLGPKPGETDIDVKKLEESISDAIWRCIRKVGPQLGLTVGHSYLDPETDQRLRPIIRHLGDAKEGFMRLCKSLLRSA